MTKLMLFLNTIKKSRPRYLLCSIFIFLLLACAPTLPTYSRKDIEKTIKELCKKEFSIDVKVYEKGDTVWVYAPRENLANEKGDWDEKILKDMDRILLSLSRVILSMDKRPKFYCFLISDIKNGFDIYRVCYIRDLLMYHTEFISRGEFHERQAIIYYTNPQSIADKNGSHIYMYDVSLGEFISMLIKQGLEKKFTAPAVKDNYAVNEIKCNYALGSLKVSFDITQKKYKEGLEEPSEEVEKTIKKFLKIYEYPEDISEVEIYDIDTRKHNFYSRKSLLAGK